MDHAWLARITQLIGEEWQEGRRKVAPWWRGLAAEASSSEAISDDPFLDLTEPERAEALTSWLGPRLTRALRILRPSLRNRGWELAFTPGREELEPPHTERALAVAHHAGEAAGRWRGDMLLCLLTDPDFFRGFDGLPLFSQQHPVDPLSPKGPAYSNLLRLTLSDHSLGLAVDRLRTLTTPEGQPLGLRPDVLLVPPQLEERAKALLAAWRRILPFPRPALLVVPQLAEHPEDWYLLATGHLLKPFGLQIRQETRLDRDFVIEEEGEADEEIFGFSTFARGTAAGTLPFLCLKGSPGARS